MPFTIKVHNRNLPSADKATSSPFPLQLSFSSAPTLAALKAEIHGKVPKLTPSRQRITNEDKKPLLDDAQQVNVSSGSDLYVKDLGPQVAWRTVFLTEYFGPLFIHPLWFYGIAPRLYGSKWQPSAVQEVAMGLIVLHYLKREVETVFVHRFSAATMPLFNIFKNSTHYWVLSGVLLAGAIYHPNLCEQAVRGTLQANPAFIAGCAVVWTLAQLGNFRSHMILRSLRSAGGKERKIPRGFAFELVSCPNYLFETIAWLSITILTASPAAALFSAVSVGQMAIWAAKKHRNYKKEFGKEYPRGRKAMFPLVF
ncbi:hypothetical protein BDZ90DRAFT_22286 [Jaminaea rosea]|uniref:very-long-chain enoyl-CoA reductase n=1 Tax=Jaminaea rosea TaxID=1569628 RepID=A0A316UZK1_9BASI|nr:hypothetical protein BDZ90DRAFT_22286 [Jaminaea rosea]PWN30730.1 hypothetical protein BDZ90DRAFT_22286 [Jaminaea rosea]